MSIKAVAELELNSIDDKASQEDFELAMDTAAAAQVSVDDIDLLINGGYVTEITSSYGDDEIRCDRSSFYEAVDGVLGSYAFSYDGTDWRLEGNVVDLEQYGIALEITPTSGDTFTIDLVSVEGAMTDITQQISSLSDTVEANEAKAATDLESAQAELQAQIDDNTGALSQAQASIRTISTKTASMGYSDDYGLVLYGKDADASTGYKLQLAAGAINFINGGLGNAAAIKATLAADINTGQVFMIINDAVINNQLKFGNFAFIPRSNGNMALKYIG